MNAEFAEIDVKDVASLKDFINFEKEQVKQEALGIMIKNGKSEKVNFNQDVLKRAIKVRIDIAEKEAECYILVYEKMKKLLAEQDTETVRLNKYKKTLRDTSVKLAFLNAQREYIVGFLDYERMTAIMGNKIHSQMMIEACNNFELDLIQIEKLYELIQREITNRSTKKGYNQLYNKTYLKHIEDKEKNFKQEVNNVNISMGTVINSNYWRIEGIKNIYNVFQEEVSKKFNKDLSEYKIEEPEEKPIKRQPVAVAKVKKEEHFKQFKYDEDGAYDEEDYEEDYQEEQKPQKIEIEQEIEIEEDNDSYSYEEDESFGHQYKIDDYDFLVNEEYDKDDYEEEQQEDLQEETYEEETTYDDEYDNEYDEDDNYEDNYEDEYENEQQPIIVARSNPPIKNEHNYKQDNEEEKYNQYNNSYEEDDDDDEEPYTSNNYNNSYYNNYGNNDNFNNYTNDDDDYDDDYSEEDTYNNNYEDDYEEEEQDNQDYYEEDYDEDDGYKAYNTPSYGFKRSPYLDDDEDEEYENIYEYNYDDDEEEYRRQKLQSKTVISFDDEESIDMIIANSRKRSNTRKSNGKGLFNKLFKK